MGSAPDPSLYLARTGTSAPNQRIREPRYFINSGPLTTLHGHNETGALLVYVRPPGRATMTNDIAVF